MARLFPLCRVITTETDTPTFWSSLKKRTRKTSSHSSSGPIGNQTTIFTIYVLAIGYQFFFLVFCNTRIIFLLRKQSYNFKIFWKLIDYDGIPQCIILNQFPISIKKKSVLQIGYRANKCQPLQVRGHEKQDSKLLNPSEQRH